MGRSDRRLGTCPRRKHGRLQLGARLPPGRKTGIAYTSNGAVYSAENDFISDYTSFLPQTPSDKNIQALEESVVQVVSFDGLHQLYRNVAQGERFGRLIAEEIFLDSISQLASFYSDKPAVHYRSFSRGCSAIALMTI